MENLCVVCKRFHSVVAWPLECDQCGISMWATKYDIQHGDNWNCECDKHCSHLCHHCCECKIDIELCFNK
jgi:hypothetical protein